MDIRFTDSFTKSLKKLIIRESWWYKTYEFFRYKIPMFFKNVWYFRKELWAHRGYDYNFTLMMLSRSLQKIVYYLEKYGQEVDYSRNKKIIKIKRAIEIINNINNYNYLSLAELEIGTLYQSDWIFEDVGSDLYKLKDTLTEFQKAHNKKVYDLSHKIEKDEWVELWNIMKGQNYEDYILYESCLTEKEKKSTDQYYKWFDGSGMNGWWD